MTATLMVLYLLRDASNAEVLVMTVGMAIMSLLIATPLFLLDYYGPQVYRSLRRRWILYDYARWETRHNLRHDAKMRELQAGMLELSVDSVQGGMTEVSK